MITHCKKCGNELTTPVSVNHIGDMIGFCESCKQQYAEEKRQRDLFAVTTEPYKP